MQVQQLTQWHRLENGDFLRIKRGLETRYSMGAKIGSGNRASVFNLEPVEGKGKSKALKITINKRVFDEFIILRNLNRHGPVTGIMKAPKAIITIQTESPLYFIIMPKYVGSLRQIVQEKQLRPLQLIQGVKEVVQGLRYLKQLDFAHCDICLANILVGVWKDQLRFDLADFEFCVDFSKFNLARHFLEIFHRRKMPFVRDLLDQRPENYISYGKMCFMRWDALCLGASLTYMKLLKKTDTTEKLAQLGEHILRTKTIDDALLKLAELKASF